MDPTSRMPLRAPLVLFDWDGTLLDSAPTTAAVWRDVLGELGSEITRSVVIDDLFAMGWPGAYLHLAEVVELPPEAQLAELLRDRRRHYASLLRLFKDSLPCLTWLSSQGVLLGVVTNSSRLRFQNDAELVRLPQQLFEVVVTADDVDSHKPAPDGYLAAIARVTQPRSTDWSGVR